MTVGVVGLGLIGGSIGLALREPGRTILGCDASSEHERLAAERFCVDRIEPLEEVAKAEIVFVAVPPASIAETLDRIGAVRGEDTVVTDCASVKEVAVTWAKRAKAKWFVPGHPMAGHEKSGPGFASAWMFKGARWILTPVALTDKAAVRRVEAAVKLMGAVPVRLAPEVHDRHVAVLSHLPHVLAAALAPMASDLDAPEAAAGSWRDLTRVAASDPELWTQIVLGNRAAVVAATDDLIARLSALREAVNEENVENVKEAFRAAQAARMSEPEKVEPQKTVKARR
ncbi:hypothetical protein BH11ARM2_BH11ARM2_20610 [soil metagenome]